MTQAETLVVFPGHERWLTLAELLAIHAAVVEATHATPGVLQVHAAKSAVERPLASFAGHTVFPSLLQKIAALMHSLVAFHPFVDANEQTALVAASVLLELNGLQLPSSVSAHDRAQMVRAVARGQADEHSLAEWLTQHVEPIEP